MRVLLQRVVQAAVKVDGLIEGRIGPGLVVSIGFGKGDTLESARRVADQVLSLTLWPDQSDLEAEWQTGLVENGFEVLLLFEPTLCAPFLKTGAPHLAGALARAEAQPILDAFVGRLRSSYREEMIVLAPLDAPSRCVDMTVEAGGSFELSCGAHAVGPRPPQAPATAGPAPPVLPPLQPEVAPVTKLMKRLPQMARSQALMHSARIFKAISLPDFRTRLADGTQGEADEFAAALEDAAGIFTQQQRTLLSRWTGLAFSGLPASDEGLAEAEAAEAPPVGTDNAELERQLAELADEVANPSKGISAAKRRRVAEEAQTDVKAGKPQPADLTGRAAPETPAALAARHWASSRARAARPPAQALTPAIVGGKAGGKAAIKGMPNRLPPQRRSWGIASLDTSARLHGTNAGGHHFGQHTKYPGSAVLLQAKEEPGAAVKGKGASKAAPKLTRWQKGLPTVAPMCPAPDPDAADGQEQEDEFL